MKRIDIVNLRTIDGRLRSIQSKIPDPDRWSTWAARLDGIARTVRTTACWTMFILVVAVALAVGSLVTTTFTAEQFRPYSDRIIPAAIIPMYSPMYAPEEAIEELGFASKQLGLWVIMIARRIRWARVSTRSSALTSDTSTCRT